MIGDGMSLQYSENSGEAYIYKYISIIFWSEASLMVGSIRILTNQGKIEKNIKSLNQTTSRA